MMEAMIWITGNVASDVQLREPREGLVYASFRMGCTPRAWHAGEWGDDQTTWIGVTCSKALAMNVKSSIGKGDPVVVVGRLRTQRWTDQQGVQQERLVLDAQSVGHDLSRGTSVFRRPVKPVLEELEVNLGELIRATEEDPEDLADEPEGSAA